MGDGIDTGFGDGFDTLSGQLRSGQHPTAGRHRPRAHAPRSRAGGPIDPRNTCQGENLSPTLSWSSAPTGTVEIAITMTDLDAPAFVHWAIAGIDPLSTSLGEGVVPEFSMQGINGTGQPGYTGPCPPAGETHTYEFTVHFLAQQTELGDGAAGADLIAAIEGSTFASASVTGTYSQS